MKYPVLAFAIVVVAWAGFAWSDSPRRSETIYEGPWHTTNRKLDGTMTCVVTRIAKDRWQGRFSGEWQGVNFDYPVEFSGPQEHLTGTATIDGADYAWTGAITPGSTSSFKGKFGGSRYEGHFELKHRPGFMAVNRD